MNKYQIENLPNKLRLVKEVYEQYVKEGLNHVGSTRLSEEQNLRLESKIDTLTLVIKDLEELLK